ncbi:hypothetical protein [Parageobacillus thermoglucosidasius]|uniref:hypothetical protein n=1 Tax=Parageobacillus thermoglucosidasius TaxID=1426 RepID=UPI000B57129C|nr:hypothetical protein [Parageobacillus thermoglucosidasius]OUM93550.1 MAG: hypothetical protein BAA00_11805 [Parageobacillus thermoglucosidasius]
MPWIAFAQNGNPNCGQLPEEWAIYGFGKRAAMIFGASSRMEADPFSKKEKFGRKKKQHAFS